MDLIVNIPTAGRPFLLERTLKSLSDCPQPPGYQETVVVENGPRCGTEDLVKAAPANLRARYVHVPIANKSTALNAVLETAGDCFIYFADDDVRLDPGVLRAYADAAAAKGPGHFFGGPTSAEYEEAPVAWLRQYLPASARGWEWTGDKDRVDQAVFLGFNWGAFAADLRAAGGFNPDRGPGSPSGATGQESDMQRRLLARGLLGTYLPSARVWHYVPKNRCSRQWAIERNFRHGLERGKLVAAEPAAIFGLPPWWVLNRYIKGIVKSALFALAPKDEVRFKGEFRRSYDRGMLEGIRIERKAAALTSRSSAVSGL